MGAAGSSGVVRALLAAACMLASVACGGSRSGAAAAGEQAPTVSRSFGDTALLGLRLLSIDARDESARVRLGRGAQIIVLGVRPGREIELISHGHHGADAFKISMRRYEEPSPDAARDADARATLEYDRCVAAAEKAARDRARQRTERRDSSGKVIPTGGNPLPTGANTSACRRPATNVAPRRLPPRDPAERYLVVLASATPISAAQLDERLATVTAVAPDVATTIEAIAAGLYVGHSGTFAGTYMVW